MEVDLLIAEGELSRPGPSAPSDLINSLMAEMKQLAMKDLSARAEMLQARSLLAEGQGAAAMERLEHALEHTRESGQSLLEAEVETLLYEACSREDAFDLAESHMRHAREILQRAAATLPKRLRQSFWRHPRRASLPQAVTPPETTKGHPIDPRRFFEVNRRLGSTHDVARVVELALDAAIELTKAERGFILLRSGSSDDEGEFEVRAARNLDRERIGRSHLKHSRSIAREVIQTRQPLVTFDAVHDERFRTNESIHAMKLKSIACVPIRAPEGVIGAVYLDNRFQKGRFTDVDLEYLLAFSDQVAIALWNAQLVASLEERTLQLEQEKKRVEELAEGQAQQIDRLSEEVQFKQETLELRYDYENIAGRSLPMQELLSTVDRVTDSPFDVLILGESGTGKELIARALHFNSSRKDRPFLALNCAALPESLLESELFGYRRGAFTGALKDKVGLFVAARGGTVFLDEVGEMSAAMQVKLLRTLEQRTVQPLGSSESVPVDIRVVAATNRNLAEEVSAGNFRNDLYFRLAVVELTVPPLRERIDDIPPIAEAILKRVTEKTGRGSKVLSSSAMNALVRHPWPGNVRQLENTLARATVLARGKKLAITDLDLGSPRKKQPEPPLDRLDFETQEARQILSALSQYRWNVSEVSRKLGIPRNTLYRKIRQYRITKRRSSAR